MELIKTLYVSGYKSFELNVFQEKDPKITIIKKVLKRELLPYVEAGLEWVLISGALGVEMWTADVVAELKMDYPELQLGIIYPFKDFGGNWNEENQQKKFKMEAIADYVNQTSNRPYENPQQLQGHTQFLLQHTNGSLLIYDEEYPGKTQFFLREAKKVAATTPYAIHLVTMDDLQSALDD